MEKLETRLAPANVDVLSYHNDLFLTGQNLQETDLTPANLQATGFGTLFSQLIDGQAYAQPLYRANLDIPGKGTHNVAFVATEHDSVYAFDADSNTGPNADPLWHDSFIDPVHGITTVPFAELSTPDIYPEIGITGTPVIDATSNTLYVVVKTKEVRGSVVHYVQKLHALDLASGNENFAGPYTLGDSIRGGPDGGWTDVTEIYVNGRGGGADPTGHVRFNAAREHDRMALQLVGDVLYIAFTSHADFRPYHGWVIGFDKTTLRPVKVFNTAPNADGVGIWQSGGGLSFDAQGNMYFAVGNGFPNTTPPFSQFDPAHGNYSESVLKLDPTPDWSPDNPQMMNVVDYFTPFNWRQLDDQDADLGSGGAILLPDGVGSAAHQNLMVETGKEGKIYLIDRDDMGRFTAGSDRVVQTVPSNLGPRVWGNPSFFQINATTGIIYYHGSGDFLKGYYITNGHIDDNPTHILRSNFRSNFPGTQPILSANGTSDPLNPVDGIVWELQVDNAAGRIQGVGDRVVAGPATLRAFNPTNLGTELYDSNQTGQRDFFGGSVKFTVPVVTNGHVLAATADHFSVLGLFPEAKAAPAAPSNLTAQLRSTPEGPQIELNWTNPAPNPGADPTGIKILRSTNGTNFTLYNTANRNRTTFTDVGPFQIGQRYYYRVAATNQRGDSALSDPVNVLVPIPPSVLTVMGTGASTAGLSWTGVANDHYDIERSTDGTTFTRIVSVPAFQTTYSDTGLTPGLYAYRIRAVNVNPNVDSLSNVRGAWVGPVMDHSTPPTAGFSNATDLTFNGSAFVGTERLLRLTDANTQAGSAFSNTRITVARFTTSFQVRLHEGTQPNYADGFTFVLQANAPTALGLGGAGIGYQGIGNSVAVKFSTFRHPGDPSSSSTRVVLNGANPAGGVDTTPSGVRLDSQNPKQIDLTYVGTTLSERIEDLLTHDVFTTSFTVNIPQVLGSDTAYVGFTGASGSNDFWELEDVASWQFTSFAPLPGAPTNLRVAAFTSSEIDLAWNANSFNETGFRVERSTDGTTFAEIGTTTTASFQDLGLATGIYFYRVRSFNDNGPSPYSTTLRASLPGSILTEHRDLGTPGDPAIAGSATFANGIYTLTGSGSDIWDTADHFHYLYRPFLGDGEMVARLVSEEFASFATKAGVMFRESLAADAKNAFMLQFPPGGRNFPTYQWRPTTGGATMDHELPSGPSVPIWLRLVRSVNTFSGYWARDTGGGTHGPWNLLGPAESFIMRPDIYVGLAVTSHNNQTAIAATFDYVQILPAPLQTAHLEVSADSAIVTAGVPFNVTVQALDAYNNPVPNYRGTVSFTSSDPIAGLPDNYPFTEADNGQHTFSVTLQTADHQTIIVTDADINQIMGGTAVDVVPGTLAPSRASPWAPAFLGPARDVSARLVPASAGPSLTSRIPDARFPVHELPPARQRESWPPLLARDPDWTDAAFVNGLDLAVGDSNRGLFDATWGDDLVYARCHTQDSRIHATC